MPRLTDASFFAAALFATACQSPTQLVVLVDSDYAIPNELATVQVLVQDELGNEVAAVAFDTAVDGLPFSFGVEPKGDVVEDTVTIQLQGLGPGDVLLVERVVAVGFIEEERRLLPIFLPRSCESAGCGAEQTCSEAGCVDPFVDVFTLPEVEEEGDELLYDFDVSGDAGQPDTGVQDAAQPDTGQPDTGMRDAGDPDPPDAAQPDADMPEDCFTTGCNQGEVCMDQIADTPCDVPGNCVCRQLCDPFDLVEDCAPGTSCYWLEEMGDPLLGICVDSDRLVSPNFRTDCVPGGCDRFENFVCHNYTNMPVEVPGECTSRCRTDLPEFCEQQIPGTTCIAPEGGTIGICLELPPPLANTGEPCMEDLTCATGRCSPALQQCNTTCTGISQCPVGAVCLFSDTAECALTCQATSDCNNSELVCRTDLIDGNSLPFAGICFHRCDVTPCVNGTSCQPNGECS